jgi:3-dehydroquinate synthase
MDPVLRRGVARFTLSAARPIEPCHIVVHHGAVRDLPSLLDRYVAAPRYLVVADDTVAGLHGKQVVSVLRDSGHVASLLTFPPGETNKTATVWLGLVERIAALAPGRDAALLALGGGVTGDMAGFAAATYARGISFVQIPTTLLAMVDAAIGGKTAIDLAAGKNLAGCFHQPRLVLVDAAFLDSLPEHGLRDGLAEAVKHGAIADAAYLQDLEESAPAIFQREPAALHRLITGSIAVKTGIVQRDPMESGERALLNFGHTVSHGIELATGYAVPHGAAVAMGMVAEATAGELAGVTAAHTADRLRQTLATFGLPHSLPPGVDRDRVLAATRADKKARRGRVRYALIRAVGQAARTDDGSWTHPLSDDTVARALARMA